MAAAEGDVSLMQCKPDNLARAAPAHSSAAHSSAGSATRAATHITAAITAAIAAAHVAAAHVAAAHVAIAATCVATHPSPPPMAVSLSTVSGRRIRAARAAAAHHSLIVAHSASTHAAAHHALTRSNRNSGQCEENYGAHDNVWPCHFFCPSSFPLFDHLLPVTRKGEQNCQSDQDHQPDSPDPGGGRTHDKSVYDNCGYDSEKRATRVKWGRRLREIVTGKQAGAKVVELRPTAG